MNIAMMNEWCEWLGKYHLKRLVLCMHIFSCKYGLKTEKHCKIPQKKKKKNNEQNESLICERMPRGLEMWVNLCKYVYVHT